MAPKEKESLSEMQAYVMHLRYRLEWYRFNGIVPPAIFLVELKMAKRLADLELKDDRRIDVKI
jgi:hypothetical protein